MKRLFLIDGNSFYYRAFFAIRALSNSKGQPTNAVYGFIAMLNKLIKSEKPDYLAFAFDKKGPTFRHEKFKEYKITRKPMPDDLKSQIPYIREYVKRAHIPFFEMDGFEADDILATLAKKASEKGIETYIVTGDKDALQLIGPKVKVYNTNKDGMIYDKEKVKEKFGVEPSKVVDIMALMGDSSDNYKGVPGIGEVTAVELIKEFGSLENLFNNLDKVASKAKKALLEKHKEDALMSQELATLHSDLPIKIDLARFEISEPDAEGLAELFKELEFKKLLKEVLPPTKLKADYKLIRDKKEFETLVEKLSECESFVLDLETTSVNPLAAEIVGISFAWEEAKAFYAACSKKDKTQLDTDYVLGKLKKPLQDASIKKIGQNIKYEINVLRNHGVTLKGISFDTMVASYLLNPSKPTHALDDISLEYLGHKMTDIKDLIGKGKKAITMDMVEVERVSDYSCEDSDVTLRLKNLLEKELESKDLHKLFTDVEMPLVSVLADMEFSGVVIDTKMLEKMAVEIDALLKGKAQDIYEMAGCEFNINSPKQLQEVLFDKLKLPIVKRTKTGASTDEEVLRKLALQHTLPQSLLEYRELARLKSAYIDSLPKLINQKTGRVHTSFNQTVTATGRLSSSAPNLQNIPIKREIGRKIRGGFITKGKDEVLLSCDYSQIELRVLAHLSEDEVLIDAFKKDLDIHTHTASLIYDVDEKKVTPQMRQSAKTVNFGIVYGMSPYGLSKELGIPPEEAKSFISAYFDRYPGVKDYLDSEIKNAREFGYVTTLMQRRRYIPEINNADPRIRQFAERTAINTPIQGSAADLIKKAMIDVHDSLMDKKLNTKMTLQVHDELVFEVSKDELKKISKLAKDKMENVFDLNVPIKVRMKIGNNWLDMKEMD